MKMNLDEKLSQLEARLGYEVTFDLVFRKLKVAHKRAALVFLDGFVNDVATIHIMRALQAMPRIGITQGALDQLLQEYIPFFEVSVADSLDAAIDELLSGTMLLLIDGIKDIAVLDVRQYVTRGSEEPTLEKVTARIA